MTAETARRLRSENRIDSLEVGECADFVTLQRNSVYDDVMEISKIDVLMTMMHGRFTYVSDDAAN